MKSEKNAEGEALSKPDAIATAPAAAVAVSDNGDVAGAIQFQLSQELADNLSMELKEALYRIEQGFGELTAPGTIWAEERPFWVIDAITIADFIDQQSGEEKVKHVFRLEFADGTIKTTMQSDTGLRRILAGAFTKARALGGRLKAGPYKYDKKPIPRQIQPAYILVQQPGFSARLY